MKDIYTYEIFNLIFNYEIFLIFFSTVKLYGSPALAKEGNEEISFYTGTFDVIDKEGDDQTSLFGIEHKNPNLFRDTFLGKFSPVSGGFMTGDNSVYLYTGVEGSIWYWKIKNFTKLYSWLL